MFLPNVALWKWCLMRVDVQGITFYKLKSAAAVAALGWGGADA